MSAIVVEQQVALSSVCAGDGRVSACLTLAPANRPRSGLGDLKDRSVLSSAPLLLASIVEALVALARNIFLAHLIAPREFGLAISLSVVAGLIEVLADFGIPVYIVRKSIDPSKQGVMATAQSLAIVRAALVAVILSALAPFLAHILGVQHDTPAFLLLGLIAFARGFENLGVKALTRDFAFGREAMVVIVSQLSGFILTIAMAAWLKSFTCVLWGMSVFTFAVVVLSNVLSPTPYRLGWDKEVAADMTAFGMPLIVNGMAVAFCLTDRLVIGGLLSPSLLALYNVMVGTAQFPRCIAVKFLTSALVPAFADQRHAPERHPHLLEGWVWVLSAMAFLYGFLLCACGREVLSFVFGPTYAPSHVVMSLTAVFIAGSFLMHMPVPPSYANGDTKIISYGSVIDAFVLVPALTTLLITRSLSSFMLAFSLAQFAGLIVLLHISRRGQLLLCPGLWAAVCTPCGLLALLAAASFGLPRATESDWLLICGVIFLFATVLYSAVFSRFCAKLPASSFNRRKARSFIGVDLQ